MDFSGTTEISDEGIKKHFKSLEPWEALFELAWNGLDARAGTVSVDVVENEIGGVERVVVLDDGDGIDIENVKDNFGKFNDSAKKEDAAQHGLHGRGRLAFHRLCHSATWHTRSKNGDAEIHVSGSNIKKYNGKRIERNAQHSRLSKVETGTCVELHNFHENLPLPAKLQQVFSTEFGWFLALNPQRHVLLNGTSVHVPSHETVRREIEVGKFVFDVTTIRWDERPSSEKSYIYLLDSDGTTRHKQLSSFNLKANFFTSIYVKSAWADGFESEGKSLFSEGNTTTDSDEWRKLTKGVNELVQEVYDEFLRKYVNAEISKYVDEGIFPSYTGMEASYAEWRTENAKSLVRMIYMADPTVMNSLNKKQKKIIVRLLDRIAVSNENDALFEILNGVLDLDDLSVRRLSNQLKYTQLENIISTIEVLQQRQTAVHKLRELMNSHYQSVLETPDLQQIIENNTWLFGSRYETIGAEEDTFTRIAKNLRDTVPTINAVDSDDVEEAATLPGATKQTDLFLARKIPTFDSFGKQIYRCIVVEIKRPGISLNLKHLQQLDGYANIIKKHPEFSSEHMHFELILLGRKISGADMEIASRMRGQIAKGEMGLVSDDERMKRYVLNWYTLLDGFELSNGHILQQLKLRRDDLSALTKDELVADLQTS
ncbi:Histidine kinase-, DNA gyrase B-, and HSP90-like ATPase [Duganella sp. CF517]|nr:Histidine kinase-, DNA gyrase B-, and HSP90-like ATPase [Duganella sp. CF517]